MILYGTAYYYIDDVSLSLCETTPPTDSLSITVPNVFTPNGDGQNDGFVLDIYGFNNLKNIQAQVFNRWGSKIAENKVEVNDKEIPASAGMTEWLIWDGRTTAATETPQGTYFYIITYTTVNDETVTKKGYVTLFR